MNYLKIALTDIAKFIPMALAWIFGIAAVLGWFMLCVIFAGLHAVNDVDRVYMTIIPFFGIPVLVIWAIVKLDDWHTSIKNRVNQNH